MFYNQTLREVSGGHFHGAITRAMLNDDRACFLSTYSSEQYESMNHRLLMGELAGFAIDGHDIVSVFNSKQNPIRGALDTMMPSAVALGG